MTEQSSTLEDLACELGVALYSVEGALSTLNPALLLAQLGLDIPCDLSADTAFAQTLDRTAQGAGALAPTIQALMAARETGDDAGVATALGQLLAAIRELATSLNDLAADFTRATATLPQAADFKAFAQTLVERLLGNALVHHLEMTHPFLRRLLTCLTVLETTTTTMTIDGDERTVTRSRLHLDRIGQLLNDPLPVFQNAYGWGNAGFDGVALFTNVRELFDALNPIAAVDDADEDGPIDLHVDDFLITPTKDVTPPGIEGRLFVDSAAPAELTLGQLTDGCRVVLRREGTLAADLALRLLPNANLEARAGSNLAGRVTLAVVGDPENVDTPLRVLAVSDACRVEAKQLSAGLIAEVKYDAAANKGTTDFRLEAKLSDGALLIDNSAFDGFLGTLLPANGLRVPINAAVTLSAGRGFTINGGAGLDATFPVNLVLGPVTVPSAHVLVNASGAGLSAEVSASFGVTLGPVTGVIDRVGLSATFALPGSGGNLGPIDVSVGFKPPSGIGLSIDAHGVLTGGGFLFHDEAQGLYAGAMQLSLHEQITLKAFGLIATRMPDGSRGYSLIVFITAEDFRPDPAGLGLHAARHRRHGRGEPHLRSGGAAPGTQERHAGNAAVPARSGGQCADA